MKSMIALSLIVLSTATFAGTKTCEKLAAEKAMDLIERKVSDDCFVRYVQPEKTDADVIHVGVACDHAGSYSVRVNTLPEGRQCTIVSLRSKELDREL